MSSHESGLVIAEKLAAAGIDATADPRSATPPCVVVAPPSLRFDTGCGATASWAVFACAPGTANLEAWTVLDQLLATVAGIFPVESVDFVSYQLSPDNPAHPAYRISFTEGVEIS